MNFKLTIKTECYFTFSSIHHHSFKKALKMKILSVVILVVMSSMVAETQWFYPYSYGYYPKYYYSKLARFNLV